MATASAIRTVRNERVQFQGLYSHVWVIKFTVDVGTLSASAQDVTEVSVPGLDPRKDVILGWTHWHTGEHSDHDIMEMMHTWTDEIHLIVHNSSGGQINPPSTEYTVVVGRLA